MKETEIWSELEHTDMPWLSTYVSIIGQLVSVGGCGSDGEPSSAVRMYSPTTEKWDLIGHNIMDIPIQECLAAVLPNNTLVVVGGFTPSIATGSNTMHVTSKVVIATTIFDPLIMHSHTCN